MGLVRKVVAVGVAAGVALLATAALPAAAAKKPKSCTLLTNAQMTKVTGATVTGPDITGTGGIACSFNIGAGLGEQGGGMVIVSLYTGSLAKGVYGAAKSGAEKIAGHRALWDGTSQSAMLFKKGKLVAVNVSYTGDNPPPDQLKPQMAQLAELAAKRL
jgi:hypothetical protein